MNPHSSALVEMESARYEETYAGESQHHLEPLQDEYSNDEDDVIPCDDDVPAMNPHLQHLPPPVGYVVHGEDDADEVVEDDPTYEEEEEEDDEEEDGTYEEPVVPDDDDDEVMSHDESLVDDEEPHLSSDGVNNEVKYQAVVHALQEGKSYSTISKETGVPKSTVGSIKRRWMTKGNLSDGRKHNGRPPKLNSKQLKMIENVLENAPGTLSSTELLKILKFEVSARTIRRAKRAIMEKRCEDRRNSVIAAARSLASQHVPSLNRGNGGPSSSSPLRSQKLLRGHRKRNLGKKEADGVLVI